MSEETILKYTIALPLLPEVGLRTAKALIEFFGSPEAVFLASETQLKQIPGIRRDTLNSLLEGRHKALLRAEKELAFIHKHDLQAWTFDDENYPYRLRECPDAPLVLYGKGHLKLNCGKFLSVVGTRMPSEFGKDFCRALVTDLSRKVENLTIVSGLAYGIDVIAHRAALEAGIPTIIIPGHGLDRIYPAIHRQVAIRALDNGGILTEYMSDTQPNPQNFVARNRIIAGLSDATLVIESKKKGGSLITAEMAAGYNREVFAVPGRPCDERATGCNELIRKQVAALIESADHLVEAMQWASPSQPSAVQTTLFPELSPEETALLDLLRCSPDGIHINLLVIETGRPYADLVATLLSLEMRGAVRSLPGGLYRALH